MPDPRFRPMFRRRGLAGQAVAALSAAQIQQLAANAGFPENDLQTAVAIALAESSGNPSAVGDRTLAPAKGPSYGLWQINVGSSANPQFAALNLFDPQTNANAAFALYSAAGGFSPWATFTSGRYLQYLQQTAQAAPLTIDAATGLPIEDSTPTPVDTVVNAAGRSPEVLTLTLAAFGVYLLSDLLSD